MTYTNTKNAWWNTARTAVSKKKKSYDYRGLNSKKNYSSFWMDDEWDNRSKFSGLTGGERAGSDLVKVIKLSNYRRAITNFVKIVTKQDIPVLFAGSESYTNGKAICLSSDIKDNNFDVTVGLALHESSHIVLTDFNILTVMMERKHEGLEALIEKHNQHGYDSYHIHIYHMTVTDLVKNLLNWVEDRRIDDFIFSTSPGYKAYYHKLYDHYWNDKAILKGMISDRMRDSSNIDHYMFHVINMINPMFNKHAMPGLDRIVEIVDLKNIARLQNTAESMEIALQIADIILTEIAKPAAQKKEEKKQQQESAKTNAKQTPGMSGEPGDDDGEDQEEGEDEAPSEPVSDAEQRAAEKAYQEQRKFLNGEINKKKATKKLQKQLDSISKQSIEVQTVGGTEGVSTRSMLLYDFTNSAAVGNFVALQEGLEQHYETMRQLPPRGDEYNAAHKMYQELREEVHALGFDVLGGAGGVDPRSEYREAITKGLEMGALLGKKLQIHNEARERVDNRLRSGKIDAKRLAHAGYGIESVFKQISIDRYKNANLHITLDASGSMGGKKWIATLQMTIAICKAASYTQGVNVQVSIRGTDRTSQSDIPVTVCLYDSRKNKLNHIVNIMRYVEPSSMTPEGLCYEGMYKKDLFVPGNSEMDSYILNISDGEPGCHNYYGDPAIKHTRHWVNKISSENNIQVLSFFISVGEYAKLVEQFNEYSSGRKFRMMYGKDAAVVDPASALGIAKELNKKFMAKI